MGRFCSRGCAPEVPAAETCALLPVSSPVTCLPACLLVCAQAGGGGALAGKSLKAFQFVSVCSHFKKQLGELMALLNQLEPHYVRCIKPNPGSKPLLLDDMYALHQLKCGGVMEAVRISCAGEAGQPPSGAQQLSACVCCRSCGLSWSPPAAL